MFTSVKHVHLIGAGGIGVSALGKWFLRRGVLVSGQDRVASAVLDDLVKLGGVMAVADDSGLEKDVDLVIYSPAVTPEHPTRKEADARGVRSLSYPEALGELTRGHKTIAVTGTNGKSTTTSMIGLMLEAAGLDPTVVVGSLVPGFVDGNLRSGNGSWFVVEACEYREHMLLQHPTIGVITNIEEDHLDYYRDINHIHEAMQKFANQSEVLVWNADDEMSGRLEGGGWREEVGGRRLEGGGGRISCGIETGEIRAVDRRVGAGEQSFVCLDGTDRLGEIHLQIPGVYNVQNALAAIAAASKAGVPFEVCQKVLADYRGIWRRFERVGTFKGAPIISDYGHHPTAVKGVVDAAREFFPGRRIVLCFQPHQHSRTKELRPQFAEALRAADIVIVPEIYKVAGRTEKEEREISSVDLVDDVRALDENKNIRVASDLARAERMLRDLVTEGDVVIAQGAGDIDTVARNLVTSSF
ncbi:UDP-N-acetylmuramate--L-alanine ligase [Candidatus Uhrbacteria bacterium]|nr:UDP-N-acetylmuramate--L-alanine ligase [Candidatus Uhrbacteria bacterium]